MNALQSGMGMHGVLLLGIDRGKDKLYQWLSPVRNFFVLGSWDSLKINSLPTVWTPNGLLSFDGNVWDTPIQPSNNYPVIPILASSGQNLYIANAQLLEVNGILANGIARWSASTNTWASMGSGIKQTTLVAGLAASETEVFVGGSIIEAGGQFVNNIGLFDIQSNTWNPLAGSSTLGLFSAFVRTEPLIVDAGGLVAIGEFQFAGDKHACQWICTMERNKMATNRHRIRWSISRTFRAERFDKYWLQYID